MVEALVGLYRVLIPGDVCGGEAVLAGVAEHIVVPVVERVVPKALWRQSMLSGGIFDAAEVVVHHRDVDLIAYLGRNAIEVAQLLRVLIDQ